MHSPTSWNSPPPTFIKLNFNGSSKGNPGLARGGGIFWNDLGEILYLYSFNLGHNTKNGVELTALVEGLKIAIQQGYQKLIIEGDATIIISICRKIINGTLPSKVSHI